jgi:hypothetical protein
MLLDNLLTYDQKVIFSIICGGFWIFFRTSECYNLIPRLHIFPVIFVCTWIYLNYYDPLFLPIGLLILIAYSNIEFVTLYLKNVHIIDKKI